MTFAEQLKSQLDIVEVIGQYVRLKRQGTGARYVGLCPFHTEKTPSFGVSSAHQFYKCFGCDASGDLFKFVQEIESLTFPETLKALAERYGIPMPQRQRSGDPEAQRREAILEMHDMAAEVFQNNLRGPAGAEARQYLESRGVSRSAMDEFRLGLSDSSGQQLTARLQKFGPDLLEQSGLAVKRQDGSGFFDRFRARLMFPVHSESGKVIAFGGRALRAADEPKYLNSPETRIYKKSSVLYNLHRAKIDARKNDRMILVEGYMDVIGVYSAGIREVVASCGTSLSIDQVRAIKRQTSQQQASAGQILLNFDPDAAGSRSAEKYIGVFLTEGLRVRIVQLQGDLDPDEYIQQNGIAAYAHRLETAASYFYWLAGRARERFDVRTVEGRVDAFKSILPSIQLVGDRVERSAISNEISDYLKLDRIIVAEQLRQTSKRTEPARKQNMSTSVVPPNEFLLLTCLLLNEDAREAIKHFLSTSSVLELLEMKAIFEAVFSLEADKIPFSLEELAKRLDPRLQRILTDLSFSDAGIQEHEAAQQALHCLRALETKATSARCSDLKRKIRDFEEQGNIAEAMRLATELDRAKEARSGQ